MRHVLRLSALVFGVCNGYHVLNCAARLAGACAVRDAFKFDPEALDALIAEEYTAFQGHYNEEGL